MISDDKFIRGEDTANVYEDKKQFDRSALIGIADKDKWEAVRQFHAARPEVPKDDLLPAGTQVSFVAPDGTEYRGKVASKSGEDYIINIADGDSYLVPPGKLAKIIPEADKIKKAMQYRVLPSINLIEQPKIEIQGRCVARIAFKERRPSDDDLIYWASQHYPNLRLVDAVNGSDREIGLVFEVQAAEDVHPQGGDSKTRAPGLMSEEIEGTGVIAADEDLEVVDLIYSDNNHKAIFSDGTILYTNPDYAVHVYSDGKTHWQSIMDSDPYVDAIDNEEMMVREATPEEAAEIIHIIDVETGNKEDPTEGDKEAIQDEVPKDYREWAEHYFPQNVSGAESEEGTDPKEYLDSPDKLPEGTHQVKERKISMREAIGPTILSLEEIIPKQAKQESIEKVIEKIAQLGEPGSAEQHEDLVRASKWVLARFNDSNPEYYAVPQETEMAGEGDTRVVRLSFTLHKRDDNDELNHLYMTKGGALVLEKSDDSDPVRGFVQVDSEANLPMVMLHTPIGPESIQEYGFNFTANSLINKIASYADIATQLYEVSEQNKELRAKLEVKLREQGIEISKAKIIDSIMRLLLSDEKFKEEMLVYLPQRPRPEYETLDPADLPEAPPKSELTTQELQLGEHPTMEDIRVVEASKQANYDACEMMANEVMSSYSEYSPDAQAEFDARLTKLAVDPKAKEYWSGYFKEYGKMWTRDIPKKKHKKSSQKIDNYAKKYWIEYFGSGVYNDSWYGQALVRDIPRRNHGDSSSQETAPTKETETDEDELVDKTKTASIESDYAAYIKEEGGKYCVKSESNTDWSGGCYDSKGEAEKRLKQVEMFKHMSKRACKEQNTNTTPELLEQFINVGLLIHDKIAQKEALFGFGKKPTQEEQLKEVTSLQDVAEQALAIADADRNMYNAIYSVIYQFLGKYPSFLRDQMRGEELSDKNVGYVLLYALRDSPKSLKQFKNYINKYQKQWQKKQWSEMEEEARGWRKQRKEEKGKKPEKGEGPIEMGPEKIELSPEELEVIPEEIELSPEEFEVIPEEPVQEELPATEQPQWYIAIGEESFGPYTTEQLKTQKDEYPDVNAWKPGMGAFMPLDQIPEFAQKETEPTTSTTLPGTEMRYSMKKKSDAAPGPWAHNAPGKDDKKDYDHKPAKIQPSRDKIKFEVTRMYSTTSSSDNGYVFMDLSWNSVDIHPRNIQQQIISFVKGLESKKEFHDFGIMGKIRIMDIDYDAGVARIKFRCSESRGVMTLTYNFETEPTALQGLR